MKRTSTLVLSVALLAAALVAGCASKSAPGSAAPAGPGGKAAPAPPSSGPFFGGLFGSGLSPALEAQRERLRDALKGTPVVVEATGEHQLRIEVPTKYAFDAGRAVVKPPLGAVLDQLAIGFKPHSATTELRINAPVDDKATAQLVNERAASTRDYLVGRGVPISRIPGLGRAAGAGLEIVLSDRAH